MGRTPKASLIVYCVMSNIMSRPLLYFRCFCLQIPLYTRAWVRSESCAPVRLNLGSISRSGSSGTVLAALSLADALAFSFPFILLWPLVHWNVVVVALALRAATVTLNNSLWVIPIYPLAL